MATKTGLKVELSFEANNPDSKTDEDNKTWQAIATENVRKVIEDLKEDAESQELINSAAEAVPPQSDASTKSREKLASQLK